jgi:serine/threonine protein kinase
MLGRGAFGVAYRGTWRGLEVAVKRILFQLMASPQGEVSRRKAMREAAINATLNHPNVVATYSWDMVPLVANSTAPVALVS